MATWVSPEKRDTAWPLFHTLFLCRVSNIQSMSTDYVKNFGVPAIGDPFIDAQTANELVERMLTINQMVEYYRKSVPVYIKKYNDTKIIYDLIAAHLNMWRHQLDTGLNVRDAPFEDLIELDKFANSVYKHAKYLFDRGYVDSLLARRLSATMRVTRDTILTPIGPTVKSYGDTTETEKPKEELPERTSMAETFAARRAYHGLTKTWK